MKKYFLLLTLLTSGATKGISGFFFSKKDLETLKKQSNDGFLGKRDQRKLDNALKAMSLIEKAFHNFVKISHVDCCALLDFYKYHPKRISCIEKSISSVIENFLNYYSTEAYLFAKNKFVLRSHVPFLKRNFTAHPIESESNTPKEVLMVMDIFKEDSAVKTDYTKIIFTQFYENFIILNEFLKNNQNINPRVFNILKDTISKKNFLEIHGHFPSLETFIIKTIQEQKKKFSQINHNYVDSVIKSEREYLKMQCTKEIKIIKRYIHRMENDFHVKFFYQQLPAVGAMENSNFGVLSYVQWDFFNTKEDRTTMENMIHQFSKKKKK